MVEKVEFEAEKIKGITVESGVKANELVKRMGHCGLQASELAKAVEVIKEMKRDGATVFLTFTSNMVSCGLRELFAQLVREKFVDCIITGIGSVEEDLMKTENDFLLGSFDADDVELHESGVNRIGNIFVPNAHYEWLEKFLKPFFEKEFAKQEKAGRLLAPSE
ncbi:deoxyhypusine synthase family protein, partial [Candidatus Micrarchaeota archaeon]|nr:deoxyhypusine synthase family protein [Candidatus Micrarchaeota archaeon]